MTSIQSLTLEVPDPTAANAFYTAAFGLDDQMDLRACDAPTDGFRGFTVSLVVSQPATVDALVGAGLDAGATSLKAPKKSFWGYGGVIQAPDGTIWKVATSSKKDTGPATRRIDEVVLLLGVADVAASKRFYVDHGLEVSRSFARKYVEFATAPVKLALYGRRALAKDAGVSPDGSGSHRLVIDSDAGPLVDLDGFAWEAAGARDGRPATPDAIVQAT
jgi:catechol 2,3-dioxygenase-like lactoylglutathione lyase family enzyme